MIVYYASGAPIKSLFETLCDDDRVTDAKIIDADIVPGGAVQATVLNAEMAAEICDDYGLIMSTSLLDLSDAEDQ